MEESQHLDRGDSAVLGGRLCQRPAEGDAFLVPLLLETGGHAWVLDTYTEQWRVEVEGKEAWFVRTDEHGGNESKV